MAPVTTPYLFIDVLTVTLNFKAGKDAIDSHLSLWQLLQDTTAFPKAPTSMGYKRSVRVELPSVKDKKHYPYLDYRFHKPTNTENGTPASPGMAERIRIRVHPRDLGPFGFVELDTIFKLFLHDGWGAFIKDGMVSKLEVSVDLPDIVLTSLHILPPKHRTCTVYRTGSTVRTIYLGKSKSDQIVLYDRGFKRLQKKQYSLAGPCTRLERKFHNANKLLKDLGSLPNPFDSLKFVDLPAKPPISKYQKKLSAEKKAAGEAIEGKADGTAYIWELFLDSVAQRTLPVALKLLPESKQKDYRKHIEAHPCPWWNKDEVWKGWQPYLDSLALVDAQFWIDGGYFTEDTSTDADADESELEDGNLPYGHML